MAAIYVMELKVNDTADNVLKQISDKGTEYKKIYLNGVTRQFDNESPDTDTPAVYKTEGGIFNRAFFHLTFDHDTSFIGYPKVKLYVEADGANDMDLFVYV